MLAGEGFGKTRQFCPPCAWIGQCYSLPGARVVAKALEVERGLVG